jgi:hypothetical protein
MESSARRVRAERNRRRTPQRGPAARWARRILGLLATAALLATGVAVATMVLPERNGSSAAAAAAPSATPAAHKPAKASHKKAVKRKPKGLTKAERAARTSALTELRNQGYTTTKASDYDPKATLRVLIGRPVGDAAGGEYAFFFNRDQFIGKDALAPSSLLRVDKHGKLSVTLVYGVYVSGDIAGRPTDRAKVRYRLEAGGIHALDNIPLSQARFMRRSG